MQECWAQSLERFAEHVDAGRAIEATRGFDAPRKVVFGMWTDAERLGRWWGRTADAGGKTKVAVRWLPIEATEAERKMFAASQAGPQQGWGGRFEQLAEYLAKG
jgi:uncharacterized protein YndB with AHSA1/START domain